MSKKKPLSERDHDIHTAKVLLSEAARRRNFGGGLYWNLLKWAANARRRAAEGDLFSAAAAPREAA